MKNKLRNAIALSLLPQILLVKALGSHPDLIERYYSEGIYPVISKFFRLLFGWIPFSIGDVLYACLLILSLGYLILKRKSILKYPLPFLRNVVMVLSVAYFTFHLMWGMNYYRLPISAKFELAKTTTNEELLAFVEELILQTNATQYQITKDTSLGVSFPDTKKQLFVKTLQGYQELGDYFPFLSYERPSLKKSLFSLPLSYMGYGGYLNPFTHEAQVNGRLPNFRFPVVSGHEIGHQLGYSAENETNFIGYLVTISNQDIHLKYAGYAYALAYCLGELQRTNTDDFDRYYARLNGGVLQNFEEMSLFWRRYENPMEPVFKSVFDIFLKANNQAAGIQSYNLVVSLMVNYHQRHPL